MAAIAVCVLSASARAVSVLAVTVLAVSILAAGPAQAAAPSIDASIEPSQIALGESANLTILTSGNGTLSINLPVVAGLEFRVVGQSRQIQMTNGITIESTSTIIRVTPEVAGVFTIPGVTPKSPPLVLRVNPGGAGPSSSPNSSSAPDRLPFVPGPNAKGLRMTPDGSAFVHLEIPKHEMFVGETVPVEIQVGMRDGFVASLNGLPKLNNDDFTLNNLSRQPERTAKAIDGKMFTVYTWRSLLGAVKPGTFSLTFETPLTVRIRTRPRQDSMLDDLLGDPFLQNIFGTTVQKDITATSPETAMTVLPLPTEGRPPDFGGAVGSFKISTEVSSAKTTAGDPLTLRMHVTGAGNFDRVDSRMLNGDDQWKTYEPKASFNSPDPTGRRGEKIFEQPIIASQPGTHTIPPLKFSYFDPSTRRYETAHSAPLTVAVSPAAASAGNEPPPTPTATGTPADEAHTGLRPDHAITDARVDSLIPLYYQPRFLAVPSALALLLCGAWAALRRMERNARGERERVRSELLSNLLKTMSQASARGDAAQFVNSASAALRQTLGARWQIAPDLVTAVDVDARLEAGERDDIRQIFALADEANYSGGDLQAADFDRWTQIVRRQLADEAVS
ncbi:MAG: BatD family protein [Gammaproteobacteria bacterium]